MSLLVRFFGVFRSPTLAALDLYRIPISNHITERMTHPRATTVQRHVMKEIPEIRSHSHYNDPHVGKYHRHGENPARATDNCMCRCVAQIGITSESGARCFSRLFLLVKIFTLGKFQLSRSSPALISQIFHDFITYTDSYRGC